MDRRLTFLPTQPNPSAVKMSRTSWFDTNCFPLPNEERITFAPTPLNYIMPEPVGLPPFPSLLGSTSLPTCPRHSPFPCPLPMGNQIAIGSAPTGMQLYSPIYTASLVTASKTIITGPVDQNAPYFEGFVNSEKVFACGICFKTFPSQQSVAGHRASHSRQMEKEARLERRKKRLASSPYKKVENNGNSVTLVNLPVGPIVTPGFGNGSGGPMARVSSVTNYLLGIADDKAKGKKVKNEADPVVVKKEGPSKDQKQGPEPEVKPDPTGYMSDETVTSKRRSPGPVMEVFDLSLRL